MKKISVIAFIVMAFAQWLIPGGMLWDKYQVRDKGTVYKFQSAPVDPVNPFKGRYVRLNFAETQYRAKTGHGLNYGSTVYVELFVNDSGFAKIKGLTKTKPAGNNFVTATVDYINNWDNTSGDIIMLKYPFEEYYTQEFNAPKIESLYLDSTMKPERTYALVKVYKGDAVIEDLFINDKRVEELLR